MKHLDGVVPAERLVSIEVNERVFTRLIKRLGAAALEVEPALEGYDAMHQQNGDDDKPRHGRLMPLPLPVA